MKFGLAILSSVSLFVSQAASEDTVQGICSSITGLYNCQAKVRLPVGAEAKMCDQRFFKVDKCKTRREYRYPCPTLRKPGRTCPGWTCEPGTVETTIQVPCGINIQTQDVDLCQQVRGALGNVGTQFINKTTAMCNCLPQALDLIGKDLFSLVRSGSGFSSAISTMIGDVVRLQKCMMDNGFDIKDNKAEVMASDLSSTDGWMVITAAEIDIATYGDLAAAISPCFLAGGCQPELIRNFFTNYLTKSKELMSDQIVKLLSGWIDIIGKIETNIETLESSVENLLAHIKKVPDKVKAVEKKVCDNSTAACVQPIVSGFMKKVSEAIEATESIQDVRDALEGAVEGVPRMINLTSAAIDVASSIPDVDDLLPMIIAGNITQIDDIMKAIQITQELPRVVRSLQEDVTTIVNFATDLGGRQDRVVSLVETVLATAWEGLPTNFTGSSSSGTGNVRAGMVEIQSIVEAEIEEPLRNVTSAAAALAESLSAMPFASGAVSVAAGVASYRRWSTISMDLPCSRPMRKTYEVAGFKGSFDYPEFYSCQYGPKDIPWPNHHIPYIKIRVGN